MPSLDDHFDALTKVRPPDTWPDIGERESRPLAPPPTTVGRRIGVAALALAVAIAGFVFMSRAFKDRRPTAPTSPVGNGLIAFSRGGPEAGLYVMDPEGTGVTRITSEEVDSDPAWSPDGSRIVFVRGFWAKDAGIYVMAADGTEPQRVTDGGSDIDGSDLEPAWSPTGTRIAFAREGRPAGADVGNADIYVVHVDGTDLARLTDGPVMEYSPTWSPDGSRIAFVGYDLASGGRPPTPMRLYLMSKDGSDIRTLGPEDVAEPAWSPDGSEIAYVDSRTGSIMAIRPDGSGPRRIIDLADVIGGVDLVFRPTWSPDGTKLAFAAGPDARDTHIYVVNRDGSGLTQLTDDPAPDVDPTWQPVPEGGSATSEPSTTCQDTTTKPQAGGPTDSVYLAPYLAGGEGWYTHSSCPAHTGDATVAWASTIPLETEHEAIAIPVDTIAALPTDGIVLTVETVISGYDPALGPFPFDLSGLSLADATVRSPNEEEPPGDYAVLEVYSEPALVRVYFGTSPPSEQLIDSAQRELDTLQLPPICPAPAEGGYGAQLSGDQGAAGDPVTLSGPMPFQREDGSYDTSGETRMIAWWNAAREDSPYLSSFSTIRPSPAVETSPLLRLGESGGDNCSFSIRFTVPDVSPGDYPIVVLQEGGGGATIEASLIFHVS
jgi:Tol biopolymer transport system component